MATPYSVGGWEVLCAHMREGIWVVTRWLRASFVLRCWRGGWARLIS